MMTEKEPLSEKERVAEFRDVEKHTNQTTFCFKSIDVKQAVKEAWDTLRFQEVSRENGLIRGIPMDSIKVIKQVFKDKFGDALLGDSEK